MTVRRQFATALALLALLCGAGCGGGDNATPGAEAEDSTYKQAKQLQKQGRESEALTAFLKVIETRGDRESAESHLEAGLIYLNHIKDPIEAIHHFRRYREFKSTSPQAKGVGDLINTALREVWRTLPARPPENQTVRLENTEEVERLRRDNEELRAQLATLRGGGAMPMSASRNPNLPGDPRSRATSPSYASTSSQVITLPPPTSNVPANDAPVLQPAPLPTAPRTTAARPAQASPPVRATPTSGRTHTVAAKDSLWSIARKYYGSAVTGAKVRSIYEANRNVMKDEGDMRPGMVLRIP